MNTSTMYMIQRKADKFFYKNGGGSSWDVSRTGWSPRLSDCRPFKTIGGAKTSRGWNGWKTVLTADACEICQQAKYHRYEHTFSERYNNSRWRKGTPETIHTWITKNGRKPCFHTYRMSDEENPLHIVPVKMQLALE
jgi:hypothetical protein